MPIQTPSNRCEELSKLRKLPRDLMLGTGGMVESGRDHLPQHPAESDEAYAVRLKGTTLYCGFSDAIKKMVGKVFSKSIAPGTDIPPQIEELLPNIDGSGRDLTAFALDVFKSAMIDGVNYIMVDFPVVSPAVEGEAPTMADQQAQGARPYTILVEAENVIGWKSENVGGRQMLTELRIEEEGFEPDPKDEYKEIAYEQIRLLLPGSFEVWRKIKDGPGAGEYMLYDGGSTSLPYIPVVPVYTNRTAYFEGEPPLLPLAELNLEHWVSSSEQRKALTFARFAMLVLAGVDQNSSVEVGPDKVLKLPQGATAAYVEPSGTGIAAGRLDLEAIEKRMEHAGMTVRVQTPQGITATAAAIDSADADAALLAAATALQDSLNQVLQVMADYLGLADGGKVTVNTTFADAVANGTSAELAQLYTVGLASKSKVISELVRRGVFDKDTDIEAEIESISSETPQLGQEQSSATNSSDMTAQPDMNAMGDQHQATLDQILTAVQAPMDMQSIVDAIAAMPAPVINVAAPIVNVPAPIVNVAAPHQDQQAIQPIVLQTGTGGGKVIQFQKDASGKISGATVSEG